MNDHRLYRGQPQKFDKCLFVPSALRGYRPKHYPFSDIPRCNGCMKILKVENFLQNLGIDTNTYKRECQTIHKKGPFQNCADDILYIFLLSIVFCEYKISRMGKNMSFAGGGVIPYHIDMGLSITDNGENVSFKIDCFESIIEYAKKMARYYFEHNPPGKSDDFIRIYMDHQHYCKGSYDYERCLVRYKNSDGKIINGDDLPDHFTFLLDWTDCKCVARKFAGEDGTIFSINSEKYDELAGANYKMSYDDEMVKFRLIDTADEQKSVVTFWPWTYTPEELEKQNGDQSGLGYELDFKIEPE